MDHMITALYKADVISLNTIEKVFKGMVCDVKKHDCMYGLCSMCKHKAHTINEKVSNLIIEWFEWKTKSEERIMKDCKEKEITFTVKETMAGTAEELFQKFSKALETYMKHEFNKFAQYKYFKSRRDNIEEKECIVHIEFSENYVCAMSEEIKSMHFGASKKQLTLHTGIMYVGNNNGETFCTVSESLEHGPSAVWAHLKKVLNDTRKNHPNIVNIEFFSDVPTTQYRQKGNYFLLSVEPQEMGLKSAKWSFFESGHGKGIPDAVEGSIKREADKKVMYCEDITSVQAFVDKMKTRKTKFILVTEEEIKVEKLRLQQNTLKPIHGTLKIHQVIVRSPGTVSYRNLSCTCTSTCNQCSETLKQVDLVNQQQKRTILRKRKLITEEKVEVAKKIKLHYEANSEMDKGNTPKQSTREVRCSRDSDETNIKHKQECSEYKESKDSQNQKDNKRHEIFSKLLNELNVCKTYMTLKKKCQTIDLSEYALTCQDISFSSPPVLEADFNVIDNMPDDIPSVADICPCIVKEDGNCLPSCGSVFAFGQSETVAEIRVRIMIELVNNENNYLDDDFLNKGVDASD
ncbi:uncharacterized protein LOC127862419 [Dreissena polymorpha]|uniref:uncharacterized protein LOC127862419 n=1 Tax=Dreissena polymorpha TaxID=45954 RepID=UPI0022653540|nr:uncharacterized protein LOC127862419 [Dreissena polymorpha]